MIEKLKKLRKTFDYIKEKQHKIKELEALYKTVSYSETTRSRIKTNYTEDVILNAISEREKLYADILQILDHYHEMVNLIDSLSEPLQQVIMRFYYVNGYSWEEVARELKLHVKTVQKQRAKAVKELESM